MNFEDVVTDEISQRSRYRTFLHQVQNHCKLPNFSTFKTILVLNLLHYLKMTKVYNFLLLIIEDFYFRRNANLFQPILWLLGKADL